jgi:hypothetical protein
MLIFSQDTHVTEMFFSGVFDKTDP